MCHKGSPSSDLNPPRHLHLLYVWPLPITLFPYSPSSMPRQMKLFSASDMLSLQLQLQNYSSIELMQRSFPNLTNSYLSLTSSYIDNKQNILPDSSKQRFSYLSSKFLKPFSPFNIVSFITLWQNFLITYMSLLQKYQLLKNKSSQIFFCSLYYIVWRYRRLLHVCEINFTSKIFFTIFNPLSKLLYHILKCMV